MISQINSSNTKDSLYNSKILIVDDAKFSRCFIEEIFINNGFNNLEFAENGKEGIKKTKSFNPDIVILDLMMPVMDGFEYCKIIRKDSKFKQLPIIVQSSATTGEEMSKAFAVGATDFIRKPISDFEVLARARVHLENKSLMNDLNIFKSRVAQELSDARIMQDSLMPCSDECKAIARKYNINVSAHFEPSSEIGGDFWGFKKVSPTKLAVYNVDLSGHGIASAINTFRLHTILHERNESFFSPNEYLTSLNDKMFQLLPTGNFATMFYGIIDVAEDVLSYSGAAAPSAFVLRGDGSVESLECHGVPIAAVSSSSYNLVSLPFYEGDILFLYSDALIETANENGVFLTEDDIKDILISMKGSESNAILSAIMHHFQKHSKIGPSDDLTLCLYHRK